MRDWHDRAVDLLSAYRFKEATVACRRASRDVTEPLERANLTCTMAHIEEAQWHFERAAGLYRGLLDLLRGKRGVEVLRIKAWRGLGRMLRAQGEYRQAAILLRRAVRHAEALVDCRIELSEALGDLGVLYRYMGRLETAVELYTRGLAVAVAARGDSDPAIAAFHHMLAGVNHVRGHLLDALRHGRRAVEIRQAALGPDHPDTVADAACLAAILIDADGLEEAERILKHGLRVFRRAYGEEHYEIAVILHNMGSIAHAKGRPAVAGRLFRKSLEMKERLLGRGHPDLTMTLNNLAVLSHETGEAVKLARRAYSIARKHLAASHPTLVLVRENLERLSVGG